MMALQCGLWTLALLLGQEGGWGPAVQVSHSTRSALAPTMDLDGGRNIHAAWTDTRTPLETDIYYALLDSTGSIIYSERPIGRPPAGGQFLAVSPAGRAQVVFGSSASSSPEIWYVQVQDGAVVLGPQLLTFTGGTRASRGGTLALDPSENAHIVFYSDRDWVGGDEVYYKKVDISGAWLVGDTRVTTDPSLSWDPRFARDSMGDLHVVWTDFRDIAGTDHGEVYYTRLDSSGNKLLTEFRLTDTPRDSSVPRVAVNALDQVHVVWRDKRDGRYQVYYSKLDRLGNVLVDQVRVSSGIPRSEAADVAVDSHGHVHLAWHDRRHGREEIYYARLDHQGNLLGPEERVTESPDFAMFPDLAVDPDNHVHVCWQEGPAGLENIFYCRRTNGAPAILSKPPRLARAGQPYVHTVQAADPEQDPLSFSLAKGPPGMTLDPDTGQLVWVPPAMAQPLSPSLQFPQFEVVLEVSDGVRVTRQEVTVALLP